MKEKKNWKQLFQAYNKHIFPRAMYSLAALVILAEEINFAGHLDTLETEQELQYALAEEKKDLSLEGRNIEAQFAGEGTCGIGIACSIKTGENSYAIFLEEEGRTRGVLRHELYHIAAGHSDEEWNLQKYMLLWEPAALVYGTWGWRL